jgi:hypothetical protein
MDFELTKPPDDDHPEGSIDIRPFLDDDRIVIYYRALPEKDLTEINGIPCTTALRTIIDIAPDYPPENVARMVTDALRRNLFTVAEALERTAEPDLADDYGARLVRAEILRRG